MLFVLLAQSFSRSFSATGYYDSEGHFSYQNITDYENGACWATFEESLNETGWYIIDLEGRPGVDGRLMGHCVGFLEGVLTHHRVMQAYNLFLDQIGIDRESPSLPQLKAFYIDHLRWLRQMIAANRDDMYWRQVSVVFSMFEGISAGFNATGTERLSELDMYVMVAMGDSLELQASWGWIPMYADILSRCTGMIQMSKDDNDIFFAHDSWTDYRGMHYAIKHYNMPCDEFISHRVSLSTQIGLLSSVDDWFINDRGMMVFETTFTLQNRTLYTDYVTPKSVMNWHRTLLAMFTSDNVKVYEDQFLRHNSGTYNNDYFIVDSKKLRHGERATRDLVISIAQLPGPLRWVEDHTEELYREGFIASFNVPKNKAASDFMEFERSYGYSASFCNYTECSRYLIAKRESPRLRDFDMFKHFMRYSDYKRDPYSVWQGKPNHGATISARGDTDDDVTLRNSHGGINTKVVKASEALTKMRMHVISGPSCETLAPLNWSEPPLDGLRHEGLPEIWNFSWIEVENKGFEYCVDFEKHACQDVNFCGWCGGCNKCMPGDLHGPYYGAKCSSGWKAIDSPDLTWMYVVFPMIAIGVVVAVAVCIVVFCRNEKPTNLILN